MERFGSGRPLFLLPLLALILISSKPLEFSARAKKNCLKAATKVETLLCFIILMTKKRETLNFKYSMLSAASFLFVEK